MFVVMYDLRAMPAGHQTFLRQRTFSVPVRRDANNQNSRKPLGHGRTLRYLIHLRLIEFHFVRTNTVRISLFHPSASFSSSLCLFRFQSSKSGKIYLHRDIRLLFSRKSMEVDSGAAYELQSFTESPIDPPFSPRCWVPSHIPPPLKSHVNTSDKLSPWLVEKALRRLTWPEPKILSFFPSVTLNRPMGERRCWETRQK